MNLYVKMKSINCQTALLIYDESISYGSFLLVRSVRVGGEFRLQGSVFGLAAHCAVDDVGALVAISARTTLPSRLTQMSTTM